MPPRKKRCRKSVWELSTWKNAWIKKSSNSDECSSSITENETDGQLEATNSSLSSASESESLPKIKFNVRKSGFIRAFGKKKKETVEQIVQPEREQTTNIEENCVEKRVEETTQSSRRSSLRRQSLKNNIPKPNTKILNTKTLHLSAISTPICPTKYTTNTRAETSWNLSLSPINESRKPKQCAVEHIENENCTFMAPPPMPLKKKEVISNVKVVDVSKIANHVTNEVAGPSNFTPATVITNDLNVQLEDSPHMTTLKYLTATVNKMKNQLNKISAPSKVKRLSNVRRRRSTVRHKLAKTRYIAPPRLDVIADGKGKETQVATHDQYEHAENHTRTSQTQNSNLPTDSWNNLVKSVLKTPQKSDSIAAMNKNENNVQTFIQKLDAVELQSGVNSKKAEKPRPTISENAATLSEHSEVSNIIKEWEQIDETPKVVHHTRQHYETDDLNIQGKNVSQQALNDHGRVILSRLQGKISGVRNSGTIRISSKSRTSTKEPLGIEESNFVHSSNGQQIIDRKVQRENNFQLPTKNSVLLVSTNVDKKISEITTNSLGNVSGTAVTRSKSRKSIKEPNATHHLRQLHKENDVDIADENESQLGCKDHGLVTNVQKKISDTIKESVGHNSGTRRGRPKSRSSAKELLRVDVSVDVHHSSQEHHEENDVQIAEANESQRACNDDGHVTNVLKKVSDTAKESVGHNSGTRRGRPKSRSLAKEVLRVDLLNTMHHLRQQQHEENDVEIADENESQRGFNEHGLVTNVQKKISDTIKESVGNNSGTRRGRPKSRSSAKESVRVDVHHSSQEHHEKSDEKIAEANESQRACNDDGHVQNVQKKVSDTVKESVGHNPGTRRGRPKSRISAKEPLELSMNGQNKISEASAESLGNSSGNTATRSKSRNLVKETPINEDSNLAHDSRQRHEENEPQQALKDHELMTSSNIQKKISDIKSSSQPITTSHTLTTDASRNKAKLVKQLLDEIDVVMATTSLKITKTIKTNNDKNIDDNPTSSANRTDTITDATALDQEVAPPPPKTRRGRPKKNKVQVIETSQISHTNSDVFKVQTIKRNIDKKIDDKPTNSTNRTDTTTDGTALDQEVAPPPTKTRRGRPKKNKVQVIETSQISHTNSDVFKVQTIKTNNDKNIDDNPTSSTNRTDTTTDGTALDQEVAPPPTKTRRGRPKKNTVQVSETSQISHTNSDGFKVPAPPKGRSKVSSVRTSSSNSTGARMIREISDNDGKSKLRTNKANGTIKKQRSESSSDILKMMEKRCANFNQKSFWQCAKKHRTVQTPLHLTSNTLSMQKRKVNNTNDQEVPQITMDTGVVSPAKKARKRAHSKDKPSKAIACIAINDHTNQTHINDLPSPVPQTYAASEVVSPTKKAGKHTQSKLSSEPAKEVSIDGNSNQTNQHSFQTLLSPFEQTSTASKVVSEVKKTIGGQRNRLSKEKRRVQTEEITRVGGTEQPSVPQSHTEVKQKEAIKCGKPIEQQVLQFDKNCARMGCFHKYKKSLATNVLLCTDCNGARETDYIAKIPILDEPSEDGVAILVGPTWSKIVSGYIIIKPECFKPRRLLSDIAVVGIVINGSALLDYNCSRYILDCYESFLINPGSVYAITNPNLDEDLRIFFAKVPENGT